MLMRLLSRCGWFSGIGTVALVAALFVSAGSAEAAFPGGDGLLAVQPLSGTGIVLVNADGSGERRVCPPAASGAWCRLIRPQWSPDGRRLVASFRGGGYWVIYPDGSCLDSGCQGFGGGFDTAFMNNPALLTAVGQQGSLVEYGIDGVAQKVLLSGAMSDPVWSSRGKLAVVRGGWIWVGSPHTLHRLAHGSAPSWSPDGRQIVFARRGWLMIGQVRGSSLRTLVRGAAPAWSPDGKWIAFFDKGHRLSVVRVSGGGVRRVGDLTGRAVDWQPLAALPPTGCPTPPGSTLIASSDTAIVTLHAGVALGCLRADGRESLLLGGGDYLSAVVAGPYAALLVSDTIYIGHFPEFQTSVDLFDLRTGCSLGTGWCEGSFPDRGFEACQTYTTSCTADQLVLGSDAVSAVHTTDVNDGCTCTVEQIVASDSTGVHTQDSVTEPSGSLGALTNLTLIGDTLTWEHNGSPRSVQLQP
jgi:hypothetical protein